MKRFSILLIVLLVTSCHPWPKPGTGGYAQYYLFLPQYACKLNPKDKHYFIFLKLTAIKKQLMAIKNHSTSACYPAYFDMLTQDLDYAAQQFVSGHFDLSYQCACKLEPNIAYLLNLETGKRCLKTLRMFEKYRRAPCDP